MSVVKCAICGLSFDKDKVKCVKHNSRRYSHFDCEPDKPLYVSLISQENAEKQELINYILNLYQVKSCSPHICKEIKDYHDSYGYSYSGILKSLQQWYEIKRNPVLDKYKGTIGIVGSIYNQAYDYYHSLYLAQTVNDKQTIQNFNIEEKVIEIPSPRTKIKQKELFNIEGDSNG